MSIWTPPGPPSLLFGVAVDDLTMVETLEAIEAFVDTGRASGRTHQIATVNVDFLVNALADESARLLLQRADVCVADGMPVVWGARLAGMQMRSRVAGADLVPALVARSVETGWKIHLFGSSAGTAEAAAELLRAQHPGARVTGVSGPRVSARGETTSEVID